MSLIAKAMVTLLKDVFPKIWWMPSATYCLILILSEVNVKIKYLPPWRLWWSSSQRHQSFSSLSGTFGKLDTHGDLFCYVFVVVEWQFEYASFDVHGNFPKTGCLGQKINHTQWLWQWNWFHRITHTMGHLLHPQWLIDVQFENIEFRGLSEYFVCRTEKDVDTSNRLENYSLLFRTDNLSFSCLITLLYFSCPHLLL